MYKIAVLGDYDSIFGFAALGLDTFTVQTREEAAEKLHQLAQGGYGIIYITEKLAAELTHEIEKISGTGHTGNYSDSGHCRKYRCRSYRCEEIGGTGCRFRYYIWQLKEVDSSV